MPRYIVPESTYFITRRTSERRFFLVPSFIVNLVVLYCLARAAARYMVDFHCISVLSTHLHIVLTDKLGNLPNFLHDLNYSIARCLNIHYDRNENFWNTEPSSVVRLETAQAVVEKITYCQLNAVKAGLVRYRWRWPGINLGPQQWLSAATKVKRPKLYFRQSDERLAQLPLKVVAPRMLTEGRQLEEVTAEVNQYVEDQERSLRHEMMAQGRSFLGEERVLKTDPFDSPKSRPERGKLKPGFAAGGDVAALKRAIARYKAFVQDYASNRLLWLAGLQHCMPAGTWWLRRHSTAVCAPNVVFDTG